MDYEIYSAIYNVVGVMEVQGGITGSEKGCHYFCAPYFQLGFCMGGIGFFKSAYSGFYFDEKRIFLFSAGNDFTGIAGDSGRPGEKGQSFGGSDDYRV